MVWEYENIKILLMLSSFQFHLKLIRYLNKNEVALLRVFSYYIGPFLKLLPSSCMSQSSGIVKGWHDADKLIKPTLHPTDGRWRVAQIPRPNFILSSWRENCKEGAWASALG